MSDYLTPVSNTNETQVYTEEHLIDMVKLRMDEIDQSVKPIVDVGVIDNKPITDIIGGLLNESRIDILKYATVDKLPKAKKDINTTGNTFLLPNDALRLLSVDATGWDRTVTTASSTESREYKRQSYDFLKSTSKNPVVAIIDGKRYDIYPIPTDNKVSVVYISSDTKYENMSEDMINALCWDCAGKAFLVMGMGDNANKAFEIYTTMIK